ncbi:peptide ABC transporter substrate-binding protein [Candidatus Saccharibacteria bacterium]|nr:peptide ABC transporter substrate-binding protein [Candidatus Saccharibacteria bacterium]
MKRFFRRRRRAVENAVEDIDESFERNLLNRFGNVLGVSRFVMGWILLVGLVATLGIIQNASLAKLYQKELPVAGGVYNEGLVGSFSTANPLFASSTVDTAVSRLVFSGLMKYDTQNQLVTDLAKKLAIDEAGKNYTVTLRDDLNWQDGEPLTSDDVVFTYSLIQNPDVNSPLRMSWQGITITKVDAKTVRFTLPGTLATFKHSLTTGILPKHILKNVAASELRASSFNTTDPIGSGPYAWVGVDLRDAASEKETGVIALTPNEYYYGTAPGFDRFLMHTYNTESALTRAYEGNEVQAASGLTKTPDSFMQVRGENRYAFVNSAIMMLFFKTNDGVTADLKVRQALLRATDTVDITKNTSLAYRPVATPILPNQIGYNKKYEQAKFDMAEARKLLDEAGWKLNSKGVRQKDGKRLTIRLNAEDTNMSKDILEHLQKTWRALGIDLQQEVQEKANFQTTLTTHEYNVLLYGVSVGADPDVYAYWHSSQADVRSTSRLNFSEYKSAAADQALEGGRTRMESQVRAVKYEPFLKAWQEDVPAIALFQPKQVYYTRGMVYGLHDSIINTDADRYNTAADWRIHTAGVTKNTK